MGSSLKRVLGTRDAAWLVAGNMIGAGIFFTPSDVAGLLPGVLWPLVAWTLGGALALAGAAVYGELGARLPHAGGDYQYLTRAFGPLWGFLVGWAAFVLSFSAAAAAMAKVTVGYLATAIPGVTEAGDLTTRALGPALLLLLTVLNVTGAKVGGRTTTVLTSIPLAALVGAFVWGLATSGPDGSLSWPSQPLAAPGDGWWVALGAAMVPVFFTYSGWNAAAYLAGELREPERTLPRALLWGTVCVTSLYLLVNLGLLGLLGDGLQSTSTPGADALRRLLGTGAERLLSLIIALAILGSANVTLMAGARIYYAMAGDGLAPRALDHANRRGVPSTALWWSGLWSALLAAVAPAEMLYRWATLAILLLSSLTVVALFVLRRRDRDFDAFLCPGYPWTPLLYLVASLAVAVSSGFYDPWGALWGVLLVGSGFVVYAVWRTCVAPRISG
jgi:APA family basic amino acid/polyamine antiporter